MTATILKFPKPAPCRELTLIRDCPESIERTMQTCETCAQRGRTLLGEELIVSPKAKAAGYGACSVWADQETAMILVTHNDEWCPAHREREKEQPR
jgi:hypothetical protein